MLAPETPPPDQFPELAPLRDVIARFDLAAHKSLGQHFLLDANLTDRITRAAGELQGRRVIEIGPGPGGLTRSLLKRGGEVVYAIEKDQRCIDALNELAEIFPGRLKILNADAAKFDISSITSDRVKIVANLPYNISTLLLVKWLRQLDNIESMTLMFQKEVGERINAVPSTKPYGRLSVMTQWLCDVRFEFDVDRRAFTPPPKVLSSVLTLTPRQEPLASAPWDKMEEIVAAAFNQRRKMLRSALKKYDLDFAGLGIEATARAEELSIEQFCAMARTI